MTKMKMTLIIVVSLILIVVIAFLAFYLINKIKTAPYETEDGYFQTVGLLNARTYKNVVAKFGEPNSMITDKNGMPMAIYDGFELHLMGDTIDNSGVSVVTVVSSEYLFGRYKIGVGSSKAEIEKAYTSAGKYTFISGSDNPRIYYAMDKGIALTFYFDDNDIVTKFDFTWQGDYWTDHW